MPTNKVIKKTAECGCVKEEDYRNDSWKDCYGYDSSSEYFDTSKPVIDKYYCETHDKILKKNRDEIKQYKKKIKKCKKEIKNVKCQIDFFNANESEYSY